MSAIHNVLRKVEDLTVTGKLRWRRVGSSFRAEVEKNYLTISTNGTKVTYVFNVYNSDGRIIGTLFDYPDSVLRRLYDEAEQSAMKDEGELETLEQNLDKLL